MKCLSFYSVCYVCRVVWGKVLHQPAWEGKRERHTVILCCFGVYRIDTICYHQGWAMAQDKDVLAVAM